MREVVMIGGPNGAGKTTAAKDLLPATLGIVEFVNADEIARGLSPFNPESQAIPAARLMLERMQTLFRERKNFSLETTCAGRGYFRILEACRAAGYQFTFLYLWLPSPDLAVARVARRVGEGGHHIPEDVIRRRYVAGLRNMLTMYLPLSDVGLVYDNSDSRGVLIAEHRPGRDIVIHDAERWRRLKESAQ